MAHFLLYGLTFCSGLFILLIEAQTTKPTRPTYKVATVLQEPWVVKTKDGGYQGFVIDVLEKVAEMSEFDYVVQSTADEEYRNMGYTGAYDGLVGDLVNDKVTIAAANLIITDAREKIVTFTRPFSTTGAQILLRVPRQPKESFTFILWPFSTDLWIVIVFAPFLIGLAIWLMERFSPFGWRKNSAKDNCKFDLGNSFFFVFSALHLQGYRELPRATSSRILAWSWWAFSLLVILFYVAGLTSLVLGNTSGGKPILPFKTFRELTKQTEVKYGGWHGMNFTSNDPTQIEIERALNSRHELYYTNLTDAVNRIRGTNGRFAAIVEGSSGKFLEQNNRRCDLLLLLERLFNIEYGFACSAGSSGVQLCDKITIALLQLRELGTLHSLALKYWHDNPKCDLTMEDDYVSIASHRRGHFSRALVIRDFTFGFIILIIGVILSGLVLLVEIIYRRKVPNKQQPNGRPSPGTNIVKSEEMQLADAETA